MTTPIIVKPGSDELFDPISLEIMWSRLINIADEMWTTVLRTAVSTIIGAAQDHGCEILDGRGNSLAHSYRSMPVFNLIMPHVTREIIKKFPLDTMKPGDIYATNDPWMCAGHLDDISVVTPIFQNDNVVAFANTVAHASSIGGALDGLHVKDFHEEGFYFPPLKLFDRGQPNETFFEIIAGNVRQPDMVLTDIEAQVAANSVAERRILEFMAEYDLNTLEDLARTVQRRSEDAMRQAISEIPDGSYSAEEQIEATGDPMTLKVAIEVRGSNLYVDYAGSDAQILGGGINCAFNYTRAHTVFPLKCMLTPGVPNNEGCFNPIHISAPERSVLNALPPASVNHRTKTGWHLHTLIFRALADVLPEKVQAGNGLMYTFIAYARDEDGNPTNAHFICGGGRGAGSGQDGSSRNCFPSSAGNVPIEVFESRVPVLVEEDTLVPNYGSGKWRGAPGQRVTVRKLPGYERSVNIYMHPDRLRFPAPGLFGGEDSEINQLLKNGETIAPGGRLASGEVILEKPGDTFTSIVAGGGGYGSPDERDLSLIKHDQDLGLVPKS